MNSAISKARYAIGMAVFCLAAGAGAQSRPSADKDKAQPTGTTGATAFQPSGSAKGEVEAGSAPAASAGAPQAAGKPGFDNKPPKGAKATCHRPQGGVDASGGENIGSSSKDNTSCTGKGKAAKKR